MRHALISFGAGTMVLGGILLSASCNQPPGSAPAAPVIQPNDVNRYQVVVASEGERGSVVFLVDTKEGMTWIYRPPQGPAMNGFWSNIPKLQVADSYWEQALRSLIAPPPAAAPATNTPPPAVAPR